MLVPAYQPLFDRLLAFAITPEREGELSAARADYFSRAGEVFEEDRSFEPRLQAFLDWFIFDRRREGDADPPSRVFAADRRLSRDEAQAFRLLSRTIHSVFVLESANEAWAGVKDLLTDARHSVSLSEPLVGMAPGDVFEARLVPFEGQLRFSSAFLFHPRTIRRELLREVERQRRGNEWLGVQELVWTLARMASRAEHYRNVPSAALYDFQRPPPKIPVARLKLDRLSVAERLGRAARLPAKTAS
jgi:hypothetical protein